MPLSEQDESLVRLFMAASFHCWEKLPDLGRRCYKAGCTVEEVRGCVRHLIVVAGYGPCLAATNHLHAAKLLVRDTPGKVGGPPGDAFKLVYGKTTKDVRRKMHAVDPTLCEMIRLHLYGDVYSSPGLQLRQKQLLMVAFLAEANMQEQLFGHLVAAMRFGNDDRSCLEAIDLGFQISPKPSNSVYKASIETLKLAHKKFKSGWPDGQTATSPAVHVADARSVRIPELVLEDGGSMIVAIEESPQPSQVCIEVAAHIDAAMKQTTPVVGLSNQALKRMTSSKEFPSSYAVPVMESQEVPDFDDLGTHSPAT